MPLDDALSALQLTDPPARPVDDDALLAQILAAPVEEAARPRPRRRRRLILATVGASLVVAVTAGWGYYETFVVDSKGLVPFLKEERQGVPLPPGASWTPIRDDTMPPDTYTNGPGMARDAALLEAQCHWERFIVDGGADAAQVGRGIAGLRRIADLMGQNSGTAGSRTVVNGYADRAARGDLGGVRQDLAVNCPPAMGGSATPDNLLALSLAEAGAPAVAVILTYPGERYVPESEQARANAAVAQARADLDAAGLSTEPAERGTGFWMTGPGVVMTQFHVSDPDAAAPIVRRAFASLSPNAGSRIELWKGPKDTQTLPLR